MRLNHAVLLPPPSVARCEGKTRKLDHATMPRSLVIIRRLRVKYRGSKEVIDGSAGLLRLSDRTLVADLGDHPEEHIGIGGLVHVPEHAGHRRSVLA